MIRSITVACRAAVEACPRSAAAALIAVGTPSCDIAMRPDLRALRLSFDTLAGELEAASLRVAQAMAAVPFDISHARAISTFVAPLQQQGQRIDLLVYESEGYSRAVTVARWLARRLGCPLSEPASAAAVASCTWMEALLQEQSRWARPVAHHGVLMLEPELQP